MTATILCALLIQAPKLRVGGDYACNIVSVKTVTHFYATVHGSSRPIAITLSGLGPAPKESWAHDAGRQYLLAIAKLAKDPSLKSSLMIRVNAITRSGVQADLYSQWQDNGSLRSYSISADLVRNGFARLIKPNKSRESIQTKAREEAKGMWTRTMPLPKAGGSFMGAVAKIYSPTTFQVRYSWGESCNALPLLKVRIWGIQEPAKNTEAYRLALSVASSLNGKLEADLSTGTLRSHGYETVFWVRSIDKDGTAACSVTYDIYTPDGLEFGYAMNTYNYAVELLLAGSARIDPKLRSVPDEYVKAETEAKAAGRGIWASSP